MLPFASLRSFAISYALIAGTALAANRTWIGVGSNDINWSTKQNWGNAIVTSGDALFFGGTNRLTNTNDFTNYSFAGITFNSGAGAFNLGGNGFTLTGGITNNSANLQTIGNSITLASGLHTIHAASGNLTLAGNLSGTGSLTKTGSNTLTLSGANTFTGGTTLNAGTLALGSAGALGSSGTISFGGGTLRYSAANTTDYSSRFSVASGQQYKVDTNGRNVTWATGLTSSAGSLVKSGSGTLTLAATSSSTYTGTTQVSGGTLLVNGSLGNTAVTIDNTGILGGSGTISGPVTLNSGGTLASGAAPGVSSGTLAISGNLTLNSGSVWNVDIASATSFDSLTGINAFTLNGTLKVLLGYSPTAGASFDLADFSGTVIGTPVFDFDSALLGVGLAWDTSTFATTGVIRVVELTPVPEPATATFAALGTLALLRRRRRR